MGFRISSSLEKTKSSYSFYFSSRHLTATLETALIIERRQNSRFNVSPFMGLYFVFTVSLDKFIEL